MLMNSKEKKLIIDLVQGDLTRENYLNESSYNPDKDTQCIVSLLTNAYQERDSDGVEYALLLGFLFQFNKNCMSILRTLLGSEWHCKHEDIVTVLDKDNDCNSAESFYEAAISQHEYLDYDEDFNLAKKAVRALGRLSCFSALVKLRLLYQSENKVIKASAAKRIKRYYLRLHI